MITFTELLRRLDEATPTSNEWEEIYEHEPVDVDRDEVYAVGNSRRVYGKWLVMRFDAGPPGIALPSLGDAFSRIMSGATGTARDAYRVVFSEPLPLEEAPPQVGFALLNNAALCALKENPGSWFATWLSARAGLGLIALGVPEYAWHLLDLCSDKDGRHSNLDKLAVFEPIRGNATLEKNLWIQRAIWHLWPHLGVQSIPILPHPEFPDSAPDVDETIEELRRINATQLLGLFEPFLDAQRQNAINEYDSHPLVKKLRKYAGVPGGPAPDIRSDEIQPWFLEWAKTVGAIQNEEPHLARIVGLVLHRLGLGEKALASLLVLPALRAADLQVVVDGIPDLRSLMGELIAAAGVLEESLADALVAAVMECHIERDWGISMLERNIDEFSKLNVVPGGIVEHYITTAQRCVHQRTSERTAAQPDFEQLLGTVRQAAARFDVGSSISEHQLEQVVRSIELPELTLALLEGAFEQLQTLEPQQRLVLSLALYQNRRGDENQVVFAYEAAKAMSELKVFELFELRLRLLTECIESKHPRISLAHLHYIRANTWIPSAPDNSNMIQLALTDSYEAMRFARVEGEPGLQADATAAGVRMLMALWDEGRETTVSYNEAHARLNEALELPISASQQAHIHQARAQLFCRHDEDLSKALQSFEVALELADESDSIYAELAAEYINTLVRAQRVDEAIRQGRKFLEKISSDQEPHELGMLSLAIGHAFFMGGKFHDAQGYLKSGLRSVRNRGGTRQIEMYAHINLVHIGLACEDEALCEEHFRFLGDHRSELDCQRECDYLTLAVAMAEANNNLIEARAALQELLACTHDKSKRVRMRLELARLDIQIGTPVSSMDGLLIEALSLPADKVRDDLLVELACNQQVDISQETRDAIIEWAPQIGRADVAARLYYLAGDRESACSVVREALKQDLNEFQEIACIHQLITALDRTEKKERRNLSDRLEKLLGDKKGYPYIRKDLATALRMDAEGDVKTIARAFWQSCCASEELNGSDARFADLAEHSPPTLVNFSDVDASVRADAAFELSAEGLCAELQEPMNAKLEAAWAMLREVDAHLLYDSARREREAQLALSAAFALAQKYANQLEASELAGVRYVLSGEQAETVVKWVLRSQEPARRLMRARLSTPENISAQMRQEWLQALAIGARSETTRLLNAIREFVPEFPIHDQETEPTWRWLLGHPGSAAISLLEGNDQSLVILMQFDSAGQKQTLVYGLDMPAPPISLDDFSRKMIGRLPEGSEAALHDQMVAWVRKYAIEPVIGVLGKPPSAVLWCPGPLLRAISPTGIWQSTPVATTASLSLPDLKNAPGRRNSTLVFLADPGSDCAEKGLGLGESGERAFQTICDAGKSRMKKIRCMASAGSRFGYEFLGEIDGIRDTPASADDLLVEAENHEVIVLIAHGVAESADAAALLCIDAYGKIDRLDVSKLQEKPDSFAGATVLLLSCESGRVGNSLAEPGGVAGTLISAGARYVVAPLWAVRLDVAERVGEQMLRGLAEGRKPWEVLVDVQATCSGNSPTLGRRPPSFQEREASEHLQRAGFVTWVG